MAGLEPKKLALLRIWQILLKHSDYDHPLTQEEIINEIYVCSCLTGILQHSVAAILIIIQTQKGYVAFDIAFLHCLPSHEECDAEGAGDVVEEIAQNCAKESGDCRGDEKHRKQLDGVHQSELSAGHAHHAQERPLAASHVVVGIQDVDATDQSHCGGDDHASAQQEKKARKGLGQASEELIRTQKHGTVCL